MRTASLRLPALWMVAVSPRFKNGHHRVEPKEAPLDLPDLQRDRLLEILYSCHKTAMVTKETSLLGLVFS